MTLKRLLHVFCIISSLFARAVISVVAGCPFGGLVLSKTDEPSYVGRTRQTKSWFVRQGRQTEPWYVSGYTSDPIVGRELRRFTLPSSSSLSPNSFVWCLVSSLCSAGAYMVNRISELGPVLMKLCSHPGAFSAKGQRKVSGGHRGHFCHSPAGTTTMSPAETHSGSSSDQPCISHGTMPEQCTRTSDVPLLAVDDSLCGSACSWGTSAAAAVLTSAKEY